jgi:hypothetical protein
LQIQTYFSNYSTTSNIIESSNNIGPSILKALEFSVDVDDEDLFS